MAQGIENENSVMDVEAHGGKRFILRGWDQPVEFESLVSESRGKDIEPVMSWVSRLLEKSRLWVLGRLKKRNLMGTQGRWARSYP